jgi:hypothetical protein
VTPKSGFVFWISDVHYKTSPFIAYGDSSLKYETHSINSVLIRLTDERWDHITEEHGELASYRKAILDTIHNPDEVYAGNHGELLAVKRVKAGKFLVVVYREERTDGFIITAFFTQRSNAFTKRKKIWPQILY